MKLKLLILLVASVAIVLVLTAFTIHSLRTAAAKTDVEHRAIQAEIKCAAEAETAAEIVKSMESEKGLAVRITESNAHYNHGLHLCVVDVSAMQFGEGKEASRLLIDPATKAALLWSIEATPEAQERKCFGADAMPMDCAKADVRWKAYMTQ